MMLLVYVVEKIYKPAVNLVEKHTGGRQQNQPEQDLGPSENKVGRMTIYTSTAKSQNKLREGKKNTKTLQHSWHPDLFSSPPSQFAGFYNN